MTGENDEDDPLPPPFDEIMFEGCLEPLMWDLAYFMDDIEEGYLEVEDEDGIQTKIFRDDWVKRLFGYAVMHTHAPEGTPLFHSSARILRHGISVIFKNSNPDFARDCSEFLIDLVKDEPLRESMREERDAWLATPQDPGARNLVVDAWNLAVFSYKTLKGMSTDHPPPAPL